MSSNKFSPVIIHFGLFRTRLTVLFLFILVCFYPLILFSQEKATFGSWSYNTAYLAGKDRWETGIFQPFRYGIGEKLELNASAILFPVLPNVGIKVKLGEKGGIQFASEHTISIPSVFQNFLSFKGTGGLISPQYSFGFMTSVGNSILASLPAGTNSIITGYAGLAFSIRSVKPDYQSSIDIPFIYQRTAHWYEGASITAGISFKSRISANFLWEESIRTFIITREYDNLFLENSGVIMWSSGGSVRLKGGYMLSWGRYPFGNHVQMWPVVDIVFGSKPDKGSL